MTQRVPADHASQIAALFAVEAEYFQRPLSDLVARMYGGELADDGATPAAVHAALKTLRRDPKRRTCPLPSDVRVQMAKQNTSAGPAVAEQIAARLCGAITRYGWTNPGRARAYMGEAGWAACQELGGYIAICQRLRSDEMSSFYAQARELCRAILDAPPPAGECRAALPGPHDTRLQGLVESVAGALGGADDAARLPAKRPARRAHG